MNVTITIEATDTYAAEEKILEAADDIRERRDLVADGCTCDMRMPKRITPNPRSGSVELLRCHGPFVVCDARKRRMQPGGVMAADPASALSRFVSATPSPAS